MKLIFAGSSAFGIPSLGKLLHTNPPLLVISQPDRAAGRSLKQKSCPLAEFALVKDLPLWQPEDVNAPESLLRIRDLQPDLIITASYGGMLRRELRHIAPLGAINLHPSLLPSYRGATPIQTALLNGDSVTGMTIFLLNARIDAGAILAQEELPILPRDNYSTLHDRLAELAADMLVNLLPEIQQGNVTPRKQDDSLATHTCKLQKNDQLLDWSLPATLVLNRIRAFASEPGAHTWFRDSQLKIIAAEITANPATNSPGTFFVNPANLSLAVNCRDFQILLKTVQPAGKKVMDIQPFLNGARIAPDERFTPNPPTSNNPQWEE